jgi:hypothetical protein
MKHLIAILLVTLSTLTCAQTTVGTHVGSWHNKPGYNNSNPGLYVNHNGMTFGSYYNSERRQSTYAGYTFNMKYADISAVVITGYNKSVVPAIIPSKTISIGYGVNVRTSLILNPLPQGASAVHFSLEKPL